MTLGFGLFLFLLLFGAPIVFALGVASLTILTLVMGVPVAIVAQRLYAGDHSNGCARAVPSV